MMRDAKIETMTRAELEKLQLKRLKTKVKEVYEKVPFYRRAFKEKGVTPEDIKTLADIKKLPFTSKLDFRDNYPYGLLAVPLDQVVRIHSSSGTTGKPIIAPYTQGDVDTWAELMARTLATAGARKDDVMQNAYGYGLFTGGLGFHYGGERLGATVIPSSTGNSKRQLLMIKDLGTTVLVCTPSYAIILAETAKEMGIDFRETKLRLGVCGAEPWSEQMRNEIESKLGITAINIYGLTEVMGPGVSVECPNKCGMHIWEDPCVHRRRGRRDRAAALRLAGARRPAVLRRRRHCGAASPRCTRVRRAARGAGRRRADRARVRDAGARSAAPPQRLRRRCSDRRARAVGAPRGIVAGQAWECEAAVAARRLPARQDRRAVRRPRPWPAPPPRAPIPSPGARSARRLGEAYQVADDLRDVLCDADELGKPVGQDAALGAAERRGAARRSPAPSARLEQLVAGAVDVDPGLPRRGRAARAHRGADARSCFPSSSPRSPPDRRRRAMARRRCRASGSALVARRIGHWRATGCSPTRASSAGRRAFR